METAELDTAQEKGSPNGHDDTWQSFDDDDALLQHIISSEPSEELVDVAEWNVKLLCRTLDAAGRIAVEAKSYDKETKTTDYRRAFDTVVIHGCYNPQTAKPFFKEKHSSFLLAHGGPTVRLAMTILRISRMLPEDANRAKKN